MGIVEGSKTQLLGIGGDVGPPLVGQQSVAGRALSFPIRAGRAPWRMPQIEDLNLSEADPSYFPYVPGGVLG